MKKLLLPITIFIISLFIIFQACKDEELPKITSINKIELTLVEDSTSYVFAQLQCDLNQNPKFAIERYGFCWDTVANVTNEKENNSFEDLSNESFHEDIENLLPNKTYYVKAYIQNGDVIIYSNELTIYTLDARPVVTTDNIINITANSAESGGTTTAYETLFPITQRGVCWAKTQNPTIADSLTNEGTGNGIFTSQLQNLDIGATYYVRAYAFNSEGISYGEEKSFTTLDGIPELTTDSISNITATSATFYGNVIENDGLEILEQGFCWSTTINSTIENNSQIVAENTLGSFNTEIAGLELNTTFYVKAYIKNIEGTFYGNEISFTTEDGLPILITTTISNITATSALSGGSINNDGGFAITSCGVCWSTNSNPTILDNHTTDGTSTGSFTSNITGLNVSTTYYVKAYATNVNGTVYGEEYSFTTEEGLPTITTTAVSNITATSAQGGGNITDDGGFSITARGICWSTNPNPTISDAQTSDGTGTGSFISSLTGLNEWTTYYLRSYATNSNGTAYGNEVVFETIGTSVTDYDGNVYGIVTIGSQIWMAENLKTTHYANGTEIKLITDNTAWGNLADNNTDDAYCYYNSDASNEYGALYTWAAAMNGAASSSTNPSVIQGACPDGWHLPSDAEWTELVNFIASDGYSGQEGTALKSTTEWSNNGNGADIYGFNALPGGYRANSSGSFIDAGYYGLWWSSTELSSTNAYFRYLLYDNADVFRNDGYKSTGFSVRCLKD